MGFERLVILDAHLLLAESLREQLRRSGVETLIGRVDRALEQVRDWRATHVLLDPGLPGAAALVERLAREAPEVAVWLLDRPGAGDASRFPRDARTASTSQCAPVRHAPVVRRSCDLAGFVAMLRDGGATGGPVAVAATRPHTTEERLVRSLTAREAEVLECLVAGAAGGVIAHRLAISPHTVRTHIQNILAKLSVGSRHEAAVIGRRAGLAPRRAFHEGSIPA